MASGDTSLGTGATLTFAGFDIELTSISLDGPECGFVQTSHLGTTTLHTYLAHELLEPGTVSIEGHLDASVDVDAVVGTNGAMTIVTGSGDSWAWTDAIMTSFSFNIPLEDVETCTASWQLNGALTITPLV